MFPSLFYCVWEYDLSTDFTGCVVWIWFMLLTLVWVGFTWCFRFNLFLSCVCTHVEASNSSSRPRLCVLICMLLVSSTDSDLPTNYVFMHDWYCVCMIVCFRALTFMCSYLCLLTLCYYLVMLLLWMLLWVGCCSNI